MSDDEDDTHPNIDTPSLNRWRHQARIERMQQLEQEKQEVEKKKQEVENEKAWVAEKLRQQDDERLRQELKKLEIQEQEVKQKEEEVKKKERLMPWNVDTISKDGFEKTMINKPTPKVDTSKMTDEEKEEYYKKFVKDNEKKLKHYGMLSKWDDCKTYLVENPVLVCEEAANYLAIWCLNLAMEEKTQLMEHVAKQVISMQYILELAKSLDRDPRSCVSSFFTRIQTAEKEYLNAFEDELSSFKERIKKRANEKIEEAMKEIEEEERQKRLGPGGLDPVDVFESLPPEMQECFEKRDIAALQGVIAKLDEETARYHMKRCVESGLWVPDANKADGEGGDAESSESEAKTEPIYSEPAAAAASSSS